MKQFTGLVLSVSFSFGALAQAPAPVAPVGGGAANQVRQNLIIPGVSMPVVQMGSEFNLTDTNLTHLIDAQMQNYFRRQADDAKFLTDQVRDIESKFIAYQNGIINNKLIVMVANSESTGKFPTVDDVIALRVQAADAEGLIRARISSLRAIKEAELPSAHVMVTQNRDVEIPPHLNLYLNKVADHYDEQLNKIQDFINAQKYSVVDKIGKRIDAQGFSIAKGQATLLSKEERKARIATIKALKSSISDAYPSQNALSLDLAEQVKGILNMQGAQERYRWSNEEDVAARDKAVARIRKTCLYRSYTRLKFRQSIGTLMVKYKKMPANFEYLKFTPNQFIDDIVSAPVRTQGQEEIATENFRNFARLARVRQGQADTFFIGTALWAWDAVRGYKTFAQVGMAVFQMLYLDAAEDLSLNTGEGIQNFALDFTKRYLANDQMKTEVENEVCSIDESRKCANGRNADMGFIQDTNVIGKAKDVMLAMREVLPNVQQAIDLQKTLDELDRVESSAVFQKANDNVDDVFKN
jgi:hypothetical protein